MEELLMALLDYKNSVNRQNGFTDMLTIIQNLLVEFDEDEEMTQEMAMEQFKGIVDQFYMEE